MESPEEKMLRRWEWALDDIGDDKNLKPYLVIFGCTSGGRYAYSRKHALEIFKREMRDHKISETHSYLTYKFSKWGRIKNLRFVRNEIDHLVRYLRETQNNSNFYVELLFEPIDKYNERVIGVGSEDFVYKEDCYM